MTLAAGTVAAGTVAAGTVAANAKMSIHKDTCISSLEPVVLGKAVLLWTSKC